MIAGVVRDRVPDGRWRCMPRPSLIDDSATPSSSRPVLRTRPFSSLRLMPRREVLRSSTLIGHGRRHCDMTRPPRRSRAQSPAVSCHRAISLPSVRSARPRTARRTAATSRDRLASGKRLTDRIDPSRRRDRRRPGRTGSAVLTLGRIRSRPSASAQPNSSPHVIARCLGSIEHVRPRAGRCASPMKTKNRYSSTRENSLARRRPSG